MRVEGVVFVEVISSSECGWGAGWEILAARVFAHLPLSSELKFGNGLRGNAVLVRPNALRSPHIS